MWYHILGRQNVSSIQTSGLTIRVKNPIRTCSMGPDTLQKEGYRALPVQIRTKGKRFFVLFCFFPYIKLKRISLVKTLSRVG